MPLIKNYFDQSGLGKDRPFCLEFTGDIDVLKLILEKGKIPNSDSLVDVGTVVCTDLTIDPSTQNVISIGEEDEDIVLIGKLRVYLWTKYPDKLINVMKKHITELVSITDVNLKLMTHDKVISVSITDNNIKEQKETWVDNPNISKQLNSYLMQKYSEILSR